MRFCLFVCFLLGWNLCLLKSYLLMKLWSASTLPMISFPMAHVARGNPPLLKVLQHGYTHYWFPLWIFLFWSPQAACDSFHIDNQNYGKQKLAISGDCNVTNDFNAQRWFIMSPEDASVTGSLTWKWRSVSVPLTADPLLEHSEKFPHTQPRQEWSSLFTTGSASKTSGTNLFRQLWLRLHFEESNQ